jgi:hypothetical protein
VQIGIPFSGSKKLYGDSWGNELKKMLKVNELNIKKLPAQAQKNKSQNQHTMKKIEVLKNGETKLHEVKMNAKQIREYVQKVENCLFDMCDKWDFQSCNNHKHPTFEGIMAAVAHTENILNTEAEIPMKFAFTKPEHCAIYMAFCFGAFDCLHMSEITTTTEKAAAMLKVLTSRKARTQILEG